MKKNPGRRARREYHRMNRRELDRERKAEKRIKATWPHRKGRY